MKPHGTVQLSRLSGNFELVGSHIRTNGAVALRIHTGYISTDFGEDRIYSDKELIEVYLSPNQFSTLLTTMNVSSGVPCTLNRVKDEDVEPYKMEKNARDHSEIYLKEILNELDDRLDNIIDRAGELKGGIKKRDELIHELTVLKSHFQSNIPFVNTAFQKQMDKVVVEAKADVDALVTHTVNKLGIESLKNKKYLIE